MKIYFNKNTKSLLVCPTHIEKLNSEKLFFFEVINWSVDIINVPLEELNSMYKNNIIINDETLEQMIKNENKDSLIIITRLYRIFDLLSIEDKTIIKKMIENAEKK